MKEVPRLEDTRRFWEENPVARGHIGPVADWADYFKRFDRLREAEDVEPYEFSNLVHGYEQSAGMKILDYGCGNGYVLSKYAANGADVCGIDITESAIEAC